MKVKTLFSAIFALPLIYASTSDLCKTGTVEDVMTMLKASDDGPQVQHQRAQQCFDEAVRAKNFTLLEAFPIMHPLDPASILDAFKDEDASYFDAFKLTELLLNFDWVANGQETVSGLALFRSLLMSGEVNIDMLSGIFEHAAKEGHLDLIKSLVEMIQDEAMASSIAIHATTHVGAPYDASAVIKNCLLVAFSGASSKGHFDLVKYLLSKFSPRQEDLEELFMSACDFGRFDVATLVCSQYGVKPNTFAKGAVSRMVYNGNIKGLQFLIKNGVDPSAIDNSVLVAAFCRKSKEMFEYILSFPNINPVFVLSNLVKNTRYLSNLANLDLLLADLRVYGALEGYMVERVLSNPCSGKTKLVLLNWLARNFPSLSWIPTYRKAVLLDPKSAKIHQPIIDQAISSLRATGYRSTAALIKAWAEVLLGYATAIAAVHGVSDFMDIFEPYLVTSLPIQL